MSLHPIGNSISLISLLRFEYFYLEKLQIQQILLQLRQLQEINPIKIKETTFVELNELLKEGLEVTIDKPIRMNNDS